MRSIRVICEIFVFLLVFMQTSMGVKPQIPPIKILLYLIFVICDVRHAAFANFHVGCVLVNQMPTFRVETMPYSGVKDSGVGREGVKYAMEEMTEPRGLVVKLG